MRTPGQGGGPPTSGRAGELRSTGNWGNFREAWGAGGRSQELSGVGERAPWWENSVQRPGYAEGTGVADPLGRQEADAPTLDPDRWA